MTNEPPELPSRGMAPGTTPGTTPELAGLIRVVAAVLRDDDGRWLVGKRPTEKRHGGLWEFPGGKMDPGETTLDAVRRELTEELGLRTTSIGRTLHTMHDPGSPFVIDFIEADALGTAVAHEHEEIGWFDLDALLALPLAPADRAFVRTLAARRQ